MFAAALRRALRLPLLVGLLFAGLGTVLLLFPLTGAAFRRAAIRVWSRALCAACGLRLVECSAPGARTLSALPPGRMVVANHVSWLDIFAINAHCPASFVAKAEIARWPLIGTLVARTGTLFIERGKRRAVHRMIEHIDRSLQAGGRVAVFPEGTTSDGLRLLPFHANLLQGAVEAGAPVLPVGLRYLGPDGQPSAVVDYTGDVTFVASLWRVIGAPGVRCELHTLPEIDGAGRARHAIAQQARTMLAARLGLPTDDAVPERIRALRLGPRDAA